jgi:hypothetical protein
MEKIPITKDNLIYAQCELDFTHDHSSVEVGSIMFNYNGEAHEVTKIDTDDCGRRQFWSDDKCLGVQYRSPHNMLTKSPFYAHEYKVSGFKST